MPTRVELEDEGFVGLNPRSGGAQAASRMLAERVRTLEDAVIGLVVNGLQEEMMVSLAEEVARRTGAKRVLKITKHGISVPPEPDDWKRLTNEVQVAITGYGG